MHVFGGGLKAALLSFLIFSSPVAFGQTTTNLLNNSGFESGSTGWTLGSNSRIVSTSCQSGSKCLQLGTAVGAATQNLNSKIQAGSKYSFTGQLRLSATSGKVVPSIRFMDSTGKEIGVFLAVSKAQLNYQAFRIDFTAPAKYTNVIVRLRKETSGYMDHFDSLVLTKVSAATTPSPPSPTPAPTPAPTPVAPVEVGSIRLPFQNTDPTSYLYVSTSGNDSASGSQSAPLRTIQAAINKAKGKPGTAIMVKAGIYNGSIDMGGLHGTVDRPIRLVSADGVGRAEIRGTAEKAAVTAYGISYVSFDGFRVVPSVSSEQGDVGGFKIWGPWESPARNLVFANNIIAGRGMDGFKLFGGARNNVIIGNVFEGAWFQEAIDNVSVEKTVYAYNTIRGSAGYTGLTIKTGSRDSEIVGNLVDIKAGAGIFIGGIGSSQLTRSFPAYWDAGWEAKNIRVHKNVVTANVTGKSANFVGSNNCVLENNYLARIVGSRQNEVAGVFKYVAYDNKILNNSVTLADFFKPDPGNSSGFIIQGNIVGGARPEAGAESAAADALLTALGL